MAAEVELPGGTVEVSPGDVVSMHSPQLTRIAVVGAAAGAWAVRLGSRTFEYEAAPGDDAETIAASLAAVILEEQTQLALRVSGAVIDVAGGPGIEFEAERVSPDDDALLTVATAQVATTGRIPGTVLVLRMREYWTISRDAPGVPQHRWTISGRRQVAGPVNEDGYPTLPSTSPFMELGADEIRAAVQIGGQASSIFLSVPPAP